MGRVKTSSTSSRVGFLPPSRISIDWDDGRECRHVCGEPGDGHLGERHRAA